jgi:hypothetical protein
MYRVIVSVIKYIIKYIYKYIVYKVERVYKLKLYTCYTYYSLLKCNIYNLSNGDSSSN